jgi:Stigma-specific protein, Stig1
MAIRFTAELSHYTSAGTYATQVGIDASAALLAPPLALPEMAPALHQPVFGKNCVLGPRYEICCVTSRGVVECTYPTSCPPGLELCRDEGGCIEVESDPNNCGGCGRKCLSGQGCYDGRCLTILPTGCPANYTRCDGVCCVPGSTCLNGTCQCPGQAPTTHGCGYGCGTSVATCSPTGQWSFTDPPALCVNDGVCFKGSTLACGLGTATCGTNCQWEGPCTCSDPSYAVCGQNPGQCVDTNTDPNNCGACGNQCSGGQVCCDGFCATCPTGGICNGGGGCVCPEGTAECTPGQCQDVLSDPANCGYLCQQCPSNYPNCCLGSCTDISNDPNNCGECAYQCGIDLMSDYLLNCVNGTCTCQGPESCCVGEGGCPYGLTASSCNYILWNPFPEDPSICRPIGDLNLTFAVHTDMATSVDAQGYTGFSLQLNANPPLNAQSGIQWMQFGFFVGGPFEGQIVPGIQYWQGQTASSPVLNLRGPNLVNPGLPSNILPAGTTLFIRLNTDDQGNVINTEFAASGPEFLFGPEGPVPLYWTTEPVVIQIPQQYTAQVYAFEAEVVGPDDGLFANFTTGEGTLQYSVLGQSPPAQLCARPDLPPCAAGWPGTGESSNATYGPTEPSGPDSCCYEYVDQTVSIAAH